MRLLFVIPSALLAAAAAFASAGINTAAAQACEGPFRHCAFEVNAKCSRDRDGEQRMTFKDVLGKTAQFERCVGQVYEQRGLPNPYKTGDTTSEQLPFPRSEIIDPRFH
jgi:hypothetical protein